MNRLYIVAIWRSHFSAIFLVSLLDILHQHGQSSSRFTSFYFFCIARRKELSSDLSPSSFQIVNFSILCETTEESTVIIRSRLFWTTDPVCRLFICNMTHLIYHLRSVRADHAHVQVVAQLHLQLGLPVLIGPMRRYRWRWWRRRRTIVSLTISFASGRPILLPLSCVMMVVMSSVAVDRQSGIRGLAAVGLKPGG